MAEQIAAAQVTLHNRISETPCVIRADDRALRQIFLNLLSNAVKFTPEGGRVDVWSEFDSAGRLHISVRDTGIGISKEDLEMVFEPFKQIESKVARKHKGTGLGLPLTQRLVALHGGAVEIDSTLGHGTTVRIVLEPQTVVSGSALHFPSALNAHTLPAVEGSSISRQTGKASSVSADFISAPPSIHSVNSSRPSSLKQLRSR